MPVWRLLLVRPVTNGKDIYRYKVVRNVKFLADNSRIKIGDPTGRKPQILGAQHYVVRGYRTVNFNHACPVKRAYPYGFPVGANNNGQRSAVR